MERPARNASKVMLAAVTRQFIPSRIERELLAQVFEFVVTEQHPERSTAANAFDAQQPKVAPRVSNPSIARLAARSAA
jgi:hypothetical protein